jgi:uncharacterized protein YjbJ (UPF0337 family)
MHAFAAKNTPCPHVRGRLYSGINAICYGFYLTLWGTIMDGIRISGSFNQFSSGLSSGIGKTASALPGANKAAANGQAAKTSGEIENAVSSGKDTVRAIEIRVNEGGAGGEVNR